MTLSLAQKVERRELRKRRAATSRVRMVGRGMYACRNCERFRCVCPGPPERLGA